MKAWGITDTGLVRKENQDAYSIWHAGGITAAVVCDGMGGAKSGNVASSLAVEVFTGEVRRTQKAGMTPEKAAELLKELRAKEEEGRSDDQN